MNDLDPLLHDLRGQLPREDLQNAPVPPSPQTMSTYHYGNIL